jgi:sugar phosphate permease
MFSQNTIAVLTASMVVSTQAPTETTNTPTKYRLVIVTLVALALLLCNADRVIMSVAGVPLAELNGWNRETLGLVQSSFLWGYTLTPFIGGIAADKYGGKNVLLVGITVWSVATVLTPLAATASLPALLLCRAVMGLGEGTCVFPNHVLPVYLPCVECSHQVLPLESGQQSTTLPVHCTKIAHHSRLCD